MNNNLIEKLLQEALNEMSQQNPNVNLSTLSGDEDNFEYSSFFNDDNNEDDFDQMSWFHDDFVNNHDGDDEDSDTFYFDSDEQKTNPNRVVYGTGMNNVSDWQKSRSHYNDVLTRDKGGRRMGMTDPNVHRYFMDPNMINPFNTRAKDSNESDICGRLKITYTTPEGKSEKYKGKKIAIITIQNVEPAHVYELCAKLSGKGNTERADIASSRQNHGKDAITFIVFYDRMEQWKKSELPFLVNYFKSKVARNKKGEVVTDKNGEPVGLYGTKEQLDELETMFDNRIYSEEEVQNALRNAYTNHVERFRQYLESEDDETINNIIELYSRYNILNELCKDLKLPQSYGHILSWKNAKAIIGQGLSTGRQLSFILPEATWRKRFGRVLKNTAKPVFVNVPNTRNWKGKWRNQTGIEQEVIDPRDGKRKKVQFKSTEDILNAFYDGKSYDDLSTQQQMSVNVMANKLNGKSTILIVEYDVSDTVWDPNLSPVDVFNQTVGLENNINGIPNALARDEIKQSELKRKQREENGEKTEDDVNVEEKDANIILMQMKTKVALENVSKFAKKHDIRVNNTIENNSLALVNLLMTIAKKYIPLKIGISKKELIDELAQNSVYFVCRLHKIALDEINSFKHVMKVDNKILATFEEITEILLKAIEQTDVKTDGKTDDDYKVALEESENIEGNEQCVLQNFSDNPDLVKSKIRAFLSKLNKEANAAEKQNINENFFKMLERMDSSKNNLL